MSVNEHLLNAFVVLLWLGPALLGAAYASRGGYRAVLGRLRGDVERPTEP